MLKIPVKLSLSLRALLLGTGILMITLALFMYYQIYENDVPIHISIIIFIAGIITLLFYDIPENEEIIAEKKKIYIILFTIVNLVLAAITPYPLIICFLMYAATGLLNLLNLTRYALIKRIYNTSTLLALISMLFAVSYYLMPKLHIAMFLKQITNYFFGLTGLPSTLSETDLLVKTSSGVIKFAISYESSGFFIIMIFFIAFLYAVYRCFKPVIKYYLFAVITVIIFFFVRYILLIGIYSIYNQNINIFYNYITLLITLFPLVLFLVYPLKRLLLNHKKPGATVAIYRVKGFAILSVFMIGAILMLIGYLGEFHGKSKASRIFIDEYHSKGWESSTEPLDMDNFGGQKSTYTYTSFVSYLDNLAPVTLIDDISQYDDITSEDILILKTPTLEFENETIKKINKFVEEGGGLLLIGDHTDLLNMSKHLNEISENYDIRFNYDATYDTKTTGLSVFSRRFSFFQSAITYRVPYYNFATSCSIITSPKVRSIMTGNALTSEYRDLATPHYFNNMTPEADDYSGLFEQCVSVRSGKGKVIAFSDSTTFSSFSVFMHRNPEFITSLIYDLMSFRNAYNMIFILIGATFIVLSVIAFIRYKYLRTHADILIISLLFAFAISNFILVLNNKSFAYKIDDKINGISQIWIVHDPEKTLITNFVGMGQNENDFSSMFIAFQRMQYFVRQKHEINGLNQIKPISVVLMQPIKLTKKEESSIIKYLMEGGNVIIIDREEIDNCADLNRLFQGYANFSKYYMEYNVKAFDSNDEIVLSKWTKYIYASNMSTYNDELFTNIAANKFPVGKGSATVLYDLSAFSNMLMGDPGIPPTQKQIDRHQSFFKTIEFALKTW
jgi:hypothetical protein